MAETPRQRATRRMGRTGKAFARAEFVAARSGDFDRAALTGALQAFLSAIPGLASLLIAGFPTTNTMRWVPIGPSVSRNRTPSSARRSTGRIKDLQVSADGRRAYAASATGGVWYTEDAGATWAPVGGWANRARRVGGANNAQSCSSILVHFGATSATDFVMVGTGMGDMVWNRTPNRPALGGVGVLSALSPATTAGAGGDPWEAESGLNVMEGKGVFRMTRDPGSTPGQHTGAGLDRVVAATNQGLFLGTRRPAGAGGEFAWVELSTLDAHVGVVAPAKPIVTDALWINLPGQALRPGQTRLDGRIIVGLCLSMDTLTTNAGLGAGVAYSDDLGATWRWVTNLNLATMVPQGVGRVSLALAPGTNRAYVLGDIDTLRGGFNPSPQLWRIPDLTVAAPTAATVGGVPADLWGSQRDWDQCIAVDIVGGVDRLYLGGSATFFGGASLWCFHVDTAAVPMTLVSAPGVSQTGPPAAPPAGGGQNAFLPGLIGDDVHADVQAIRLAGAAAPKQVWVATDGGIFVSTQAGRVNSFQPRVNGLGAVEVNFIATHPTSSHFAAIGTQDNGRHMRAGDTVWEETVWGDGGGVAFHPNLSQFVLSQAIRDDWTCTPAALFKHPLNRGNFGAPQREAGLASFYTGAAAVRQSASVGRMSLGTNRVWLTDNLGAPVPTTWRALPWPSGALADPRAGGLDPTPDFGVPRGAPLPAAPGPGLSAMGVILTQKWASPTQVLVLYERGLVRWTQSGATWSSQIMVGPPGSAALSPVITGAPNPVATILSDIGPVPGSQDFYVTTTGDAAAGDTCFFFDNATSTFHRTTLRDQLPAPSGLPRGPLDPAYTVVVDPGVTTHVYVGTVTGVWRGTRTSPTAHSWTALPNGLPQANVQDLNIWTDGTTKLLRAAVQARGVWELDIGRGTEPRRTYLRVHARDDRRRLPTPMANPRRRPGIDDPVFASPDIVVRPQANRGIAPAWQLGAAGTIDASNAPPYQLWTFQTAFRWHHPSVIANGEWSTSLGALVEQHRTGPGLGPVEPKINQALWDAIVGGTRLDAAGNIAAAGDLAVYRPPWTAPGNLAAVATELDITETVIPRSTVANVQQLFNEPCTVDVLVHHRDTRPLDPADPANPAHAFVLLLWRHAGSQGTALASPTSVADLQQYVADVLAAERITGGPGPLLALPSDPTGWFLARTPGGRALHRFGIKLDARMPRAVSINVDLSVAPATPGVPVGNHVLFLAIAGSTVDPCGEPLTLPTPAPATPTLADLVKGWPYAAMRLIQVAAR